MFLYWILPKFPKRNTYLHQDEINVPAQLMQRKWINRKAHIIYFLRKENKLSPLLSKISHARTFFLTSLSGSITVEAAAVIPLFIFCMVAALQFGNAMECAVKFGTALSENSKTMAVAAYATKYGGDLGQGGDLTVGALSAVYAQNKVVSQAGDTSAVKNINMLQSTFMGEEEVIDLVFSYQIRSPLQIIKLPQQFFLQRARVRAWTGRNASGQIGDVEDEKEEIQFAYVTEFGTVYHTDLECSYIKLSISSTTIDEVPFQRNAIGEIYRCCEYCGGKSEDGIVYTTVYGNRYHSSLTCGELKRTIRQVPISEITDKRPCSKCGKHEPHSD